MRHRLSAVARVQPPARPWCCRPGRAISPYIVDRRSIRPPQTSVINHDYTRLVHRMSVPAAGVRKVVRHRRCARYRRVEASATSWVHTFGSVHLRWVHLLWALPGCPANPREGQSTPTRGGRTGSTVRLTVDDVGFREVPRIRHATTSEAPRRGRPRQASEHGLADRRQHP